MAASFEERIAARVEQVVAEAPPLTAEQRSRLAVLLAPPWTPTTRTLQPRTAPSPPRPEEQCMPTTDPDEPSAGPALEELPALAAAMTPQQARLDLLVQKAIGYYNLGASVGDVAGILGHQLQISSITREGANASLALAVALLAHGAQTGVTYGRLDASLPAGVAGLAAEHAASLALGLEE